MPTPQKNVKPERNEKPSLPGAAPLQSGGKGEKDENTI